ncbi:MAG: cell division protein SepF [Candidatus Caccosoma sp.]|nr:cell division protein SepF [Candidatus Caccosoma sp.]
MGNKLKDFLFPSKEKNELDSTTIIVKENNKVTNNTKNIGVNSPNIITPKVFSQVEEIANELLNGRSVIVDLTDTEINEAKRICDFLNGVTFAINGKVEKVAKLVYLFSPKSN